MIRRICGSLLILVVLLCVLSNPLAAQSCTGKLGIQRWDFGTLNPFPPGCFWLAASPVGFSALIGCWGSSCPPPGWFPRCGGGGAGGPGGAGAGCPINLTNGNTYIEQTDVRIPGLGGGLGLERTWSSIWPTVLSGFQVGMFGPNWRSTYEERVFLGSGVYSGYTLYLRSDGGLWVFSSNGNLAAPASATATLSQNGTQWTLAFQNGEQRIFSYTSGSLTSIKDRNGNTTSLSYDGSNRLATVTDPASRTLTFTYGGSTGNLVTSLTSSVGISLSYSYDTQGRLIQVTKPDQTTLSFTYDNSSLITAVTDSQGKTLESHTYDTKGRGLTSSEANGVNALTVSYPQQ
jgi:YD repeat-containing protein